MAVGLAFFDLRPPARAPPAVAGSGCTRLITTVMDSRQYCRILAKGSRAKMGESMRSAAHHKPMANPVPQMIGVPSQPKRGPSSPTIQAPTAPPFPSGRTPNPLANSAHSAAKAKVLMTTPPARTQRWSVCCPLMDWISSMMAPITANHTPVPKVPNSRAANSAPRLPMAFWMFLPSLAGATNSEGASAAS